MSKLIRPAVIVLLTLFLLVFIGRSFSPAELGQALTKFPLVLLPLYLGFSFIITLLKSARLHLLLRAQKVETSYFRTTKAFIASQAITFLPGGEVGRGLFLKEELGVESTESTGPVIIQALLEILGASILLSVFSWWLHLYQRVAFLTLAFLLVAIYLLTNLRFGTWVKQRFTRVKPLKHLYPKIHKVLLSMRRGILWKNFLPRSDFLLGLCLSIMSSFLGGVLLFFLTKSFKVEINLSQGIFIYAASLLIQILSLVPGGLGFTELGAAGLLVLAGVPRSEATAIVLLFRAITFLFPILNGLLFIILFYRFKVGSLLKLNE